MWISPLCGSRLYKAAAIKKESKGEKDSAAKGTEDISDEEKEENWDEEEKVNISHLLYLNNYFPSSVKLGGMFVIILVLLLLLFAYAVSFRNC